MPLGLRHSDEAKKRIGDGARGHGRGGFNVKTKCPLCTRSMSAANVGKHINACRNTEHAEPLFGYRPSTAELKVLERCLRAHKLTVQQYIDLMISQRWKCAICGSGLSRVREHGKRMPGAGNVDHDHDTGKVRGILCMTCNIMLGAAFDDTVVLMRAAEYIKKSRN